MGPSARRAAAVAWPAFLTASVLEIFVFAFVDPATLHTFDGGGLALSDNAVYSLGFFVFWLAGAAGCLLTLLLARDAGDVNDAPPPADG